MTKVFISLLFQLLIGKCRKRLLSTAIVVGNTFFILFTLKIFLENCFQLLWKKHCFICFIFQSTSYIEIKMSVCQSRATCSKLLVRAYFCCFQIGMLKIWGSMKIILKGALSGLRIFGNWWKPFKNDEKCFLFQLKSSFVLKILKFLSWLFDDISKRLD